MNRIDDLQIRIPMAKYNTARREVANLRREREAAKEEAARLQKENLPMKAKTDGYKARFEEAKRNHETLEKEQYHKLIEKIRKEYDRNPDFDDKASEFRSEIQTIKKSRSARQRKIEAIQIEIEKLERSVQKSQSVVDGLSP